MSRISFTSTKIPSAAIKNTVVTQIIKDGEDILITLSDLPETPINLGSLDPDDIGLKIDSHVSVEPLTHPKTAFILTVIESKPKKKASSSSGADSTKSSPMSRDQFSNRLD